MWVSAWPRSERDRLAIDSTACCGWRPRELKPGAGGLYVRRAAVRFGSLREFAQHVRSATALQHLGLIGGARIAVLHVQRVNVDGRPIFFESTAEQQSFATAVAGSEREVAEAVEDWAAAIDLERLHDVRMMSNDHVRPAIDSESCLLSILLRRLGLIRNAPMEGHNDAIGHVSQARNVGGQVGASVRRACG